MPDSLAPAWLLRQLRAHEGVEADTDPASGTVQLWTQGGRRVRYRLVRAARLAESELERLLADLPRRAAGGRPLLVMDSLSDAARRRLRRANISWVERHTGAEHIVGPGLHLERVPRDHAPSRTGRSKAARRAVRLRGRSGIVAEVLLEWPSAREVSLGPLAHLAGVSKVLASRVLQRLVSERILTPIGKGPRRRWRLEQADQLLELWQAEEDRRDVLVTPMYLWARSPGALYEQLRRLDTVPWRWALGGVAAANVYAPHLTVLPDPTLWIDATIPPEDVARALGAQTVPDGANLVIWQSEGNAALQRPRRASNSEGQGLVLVSPPRAVIEAASAPGRGPDVADHLRRQLPQLSQELR